MQTLEAVISLMFLLAMETYMLDSYAEQAPLDDSLYRYQLANDAWRALYLRGGFRNLSIESSNPVRDSLESDMKSMCELTGLCTYLDGVQVASQECRNAGIAENVAVLHKFIYDQGMLREATFTLAKPASRSAQHGQ